MAYNVVSWNFILYTMHAMVFGEQLNGWGTFFIFGNATSAIDLNGSPEKSFKIERKVLQGCPLAPHLL